MKIISCNCCGVVLDTDKISFPDLAVLEEEEEGTLKNCVWDGDKFIATIKCPVCKGEVREDGE